MNHNHKKSFGLANKAVSWCHKIKSFLSLKRRETFVFLSLHLHIRWTNTCHCLPMQDLLFCFYVGHLCHTAATAS